MAWDQKTGERFLQRALIGAALLSLVVLLIQSQNDGELTTLGHALDWISWSVFLVEIVVIVARAEDPVRALGDHPLQLPSWLRS
jgi:hypothetical protein